MYKELNFIVREEQQKHIVRDNGNGSFTSFPADPANSDYIAFLKYQAEGGKVYGADEEVPAEENAQ